jgi:hypothetical protein
MMKANPVRRPNWVFDKPKSGTIKLEKLVSSCRSIKLRIFITVRNPSRP